MKDWCSARSVRFDCAADEPCPCRWILYCMQRPRGLHSWSLIISSVTAAPALPPEVSYWLLSPPSSTVITDFLPDGDTDIGYWLRNQKRGQHHTEQTAWYLTPLQSVSHPHGSTHLHTHKGYNGDWCENSDIQLGPSLTSWQLNPHWNIVSGINLTTFFASLWRC